MKRHLVARILARIILAILRLFFRLPKWLILIKLRAIKAMAKIFDPHGEAVMQIVELIDIVENDPVGLEALRNLILEARSAQLFSLLRGALIHHALKSPLDLDAMIVPPPNPRRVVDGRKITIGLAGDGYDLDLLALEYAASGIATCPVAIDAAGFENIEGLEIASREAVENGLAERALSAGVDVSVHLAAIDAERFVALFAVAKKARTNLRIFYPYIYYQPALKAKSLLAREFIGEVCTVRVRATLGGTGGQRPVPPVNENDYLSHPAFDHFLLLAWLGGPIESMTAYLNPMTPKRGGQGLIAFKYTDPGRVGMLELTYAPQMYLRSKHSPYDVDAEIAGTDGIIWLTRTMAERTSAPPVEVRVGMRSLAFGVESGLDDQWTSVYRYAADELLRMVIYNELPLLTYDETLSALIAKDAAYRSTTGKDIVVLT